MKTYRLCIAICTAFVFFTSNVFSQEFVENYQWHFKIQKIGKIDEKKWSDAYHLQMSDDMEVNSNYKMLSVDVFPYEKVIIDKNQYADSLLNRFLYNTLGNPNGYSLVKREEITINGVKGLKGRFQLVGENTTIKMLSLVLPALKNCYQIFLISSINSMSFEELDKVINTFEFKSPVSLEAEKAAQVKKLTADFIKSKKQYKSTKDSYKVSFPNTCDTLEFSSTVGDMINMKQTCNSYSIDLDAFLAVYITELPLSAITKSEDEILMLFKQHQIDLDKTSIATFNDIELDGFKGFELKIMGTDKFPPLVNYYRFYLAGHKMYMLNAYDQYNNLPQEMITYFFNSFSFIDPDEIRAGKEKMKEAMDVRNKMRTMTPEERKKEFENLRRR